MFDLDNPQAWAHAFGLAESPLFGMAASANAEHRVLLDGGFGTFALSVAKSIEESREERASWAWSSDIPHHVLVTPDRITVIRWDDHSGERPFARRSVEKRIDDFYRYLVLDRVSQGQRVVEHTVGMFRKLRALILDADAEGKAVEAFMLLLASMIDRTPFKSAPLENLSAQYSLSADAVKALLSARPNALEALIEEYRTVSVGASKLQLHPDLAVRHAGGVIFQEAHFDLLRAPSPDLFGYIAQPTVKVQSRGGVHFTPPALARSIVEQTLANVDGLANKKSLVLTDPACGSGAFLIEAIRALRRVGFKGSLTVCGRDISEHAVAMARFAINRALKEWKLPVPAVVDLRVMDALTVGAIPESDVVVMNPPFGSWESLDHGQREQMRHVLGSVLKGRGDFSMAFITQALHSLKRDGAIGALFPASLLSLQAANDWRKALLERAHVRFLASLGDYGLFEYALVQVGALVLGKTDNQSDDVTTLWTKDNKATTGDALRALRRKLRGESVAASEKDWRVASVSAQSIKTATTWRISSVLNERLRSDLAKALSTRVVDLFDVQQGIRTGANDVFLITFADWKRLSKSERRWFRPATMNDSVELGRIISNVYVFYPYKNDQLSLDTEAELLRALPKYGRETLLPNKARLMNRARADSRKWWELMWRRSWLSERRPRIISKYFGERGGFGFDSDGEFAVVQGFGWTPNSLLYSQRDADDDEKETNSVGWLAAYTALFNSRVFEMMLASAAPQVAGGQYDLSPRYVNSILIPNLNEDSLAPSFGPLVRRLDILGLNVRLNEADWRDEVDLIVAALYRTKLSAWIEA